jgi:hypothetical protein
MILSSPGGYPGGLKWSPIPMTPRAGYALMHAEGPDRVQNLEMHIVFSVARPAISFVVT